MISNKVLSDHWAVLRQYTYDLTRHNGGTVRQMREVYDRGNGATLLLYSVEKKRLCSFVSSVFQPILTVTATVC